MALYVLLTISLRQRGSAESKNMEGNEDVDRDPTAAPNSPWPVKKGGWLLKLYSNSLSVAFGILFLVSWALHLYGSWQNHNVEQLAKGLPKDRIGQYLTRPEFWLRPFRTGKANSSLFSQLCFLPFIFAKKAPPNPSLSTVHIWKPENNGYQSF
jgi:hypothetical protein